MFDAQAAVLTGIAAIESRNELDHAERAKWLNASEAGTCIRKQWYRKHMPETAGEDTRGYARRGQHGETYLLDAMRAANVPLVWSGDEQITIQDTKRKISATGDGIITLDDRWIPLDLKTIDPRFNRANFPKPHHVTQLQITMALIAEQVDIPKGVKMDMGLLVYMDASNYDDIVQFEIPHDPGILDKMKARANKVLRSKTPDALDREGKTKGGKECRVECPFNDVCGVKLEAAEGRKKANRGSVLDDAAVRYMDAKDEIERLETDKDLAAEDVKVEMHKRKKSELMVGNIQILLETMVGRKSLDKKAATAAGIDLSPYEKTGASFERLTLKRT